MFVALAPLSLSAGLGYLLLNKGVVGPFNDVASRQREQTIPMQHLRLLLWDSLVSLDEYVEDGSATRVEAYRDFRKRIEIGFANLQDALAYDPATQALVERARADWTEADRIATGLLSVPAPGNAQSVERTELFHGEIGAVSDKLDAVAARTTEAINADHDRALLTYERSLWLAGIAASVSLLAVIAGVALIGRVMSTSVDRLVVGAARFAEGDREHRIHVKVPPELRRVADEFNRMIERIRETESALDKLAHVDGLTGLPNRRAFDKALSESVATVGRFGESVALLTIDIDHFKQVNDAHGHAAGDDVLRAVARVMAKGLRPVDRIFRVGGEEFAVLLHETDAEDARETAERLRNAVAATTVACDQSRISPTVSIGIAQTSRPVDESAFVGAADAALYEAKNSGRNCVVLIGKAGARGQRAA